MSDAHRLPRTGQPPRGGIPLLLPAIAIPALLSLLGWIASYLYNMFNSDVTMPDWTVDLTLVAAEILPALRSAALLAFVACFAYMGRKAGSVLWTAGVGIVVNLLFGLGSTWLSEGFGLLNPLTLLTDLVLCAAAFLIGRGVRRRADHAKSPRERKKWGMRKAAVFAAIPAVLLPAGYAVLDLAEHMGRRSALSAEIWAAGTAHFTGILMRRILIYGVLGALAAYGIASLFAALAARQNAAKKPARGAAR